MMKIEINKILLFILIWGGVALNAQDSNIANTKIAKVFDLGQVEVTEKKNR